MVVSLKKKVCLKKLKIFENITAEQIKYFGTVRAKYF
jgi:hypothetical protein